MITLRQHEFHLISDGQFIFYLYLQHPRFSILRRNFTSKSLSIFLNCPIDNSGIHRGHDDDKIPLYNPCSQEHPEIPFNLLPDESKNIAAFFVTAMNEAEWDHPEKQNSNWIDSQSALYVIKSKQRGGMGQMEVIPFKLH